VSYGVVLHLAELPTTGPASRSVRVLGTLTELDVATGTARVEHQGVCLDLDLRHIDGINWRLGELFQLLGELDVDEGGARRLRVRIARHMGNALNHELFQRALDAKRLLESQVAQTVAQEVRAAEAMALGRL